MDYLKLLNIDRWWKVVLWLGVALCGIVLTCDVKIIDAKHLLGLGFGLIIIGISIWGAQKHYIQPLPEINRLAEGPITQHNIVTLCGLITGTILTITFLFLIIKGLL